MKTYNREDLVLFSGIHKSQATGLWNYSVAILQGLLTKRKELEEIGIKRIYFLSNAVEDPDFLTLIRGNSPFLTFVNIGIFNNRYLNRFAEFFYPVKNAGNGKPIINGSRQNGTGKNKDGIIHFLSTFRSFFSSGKTIVTIHDLFQLNPPIVSQGPINRAKAFFYKQCFFSTVKNSHLITVSQYTKKELEKFLNGAFSLIHPHFSTAGADVIPSPLRQEYIKNSLYGETREQTLKNLSNDWKRDYLLVFTGRDPRKNSDRISSVLSTLLTETVEKREELLRGLSRLIIVGDNAFSLKDQLKEKLIWDSKKSPSVQISAGNSLPLSELISCYQRAKVVLFPSLAEGFGYPVYEALSQGAQVITNKEFLFSWALKFPCERLIHVCDPVSKNSIYQALLKALSITPLQKEIEAAVKEVFSHLSPTKIASKLLSVYKKALVEQQ